jgi:hypothetical protein
LSSCPSSSYHPSLLLRCRNVPPSAWAHDQNQATATYPTWCGCKQLKFLRGSHRNHVYQRAACRRPKPTAGAFGSIRRGVLCFDHSNLVNSQLLGRSHRWCITEGSSSLRAPGLDYQQQAQCAQVEVQGRYVRHSYSRLTDMLIATAQISLRQFSSPPVCASLQVDHPGNCRQGKSHTYCPALTSPTGLTHPTLPVQAKKKPSNLTHLSPHSDCSWLFLQCSHLVACVCVEILGPTILSIHT